MYLIRDTREKIPYLRIGRKTAFEATLPTGDYALAKTKKSSYTEEELLRSPFLIDRKSSVTELAGNITKAHFWRAMERLGAHPRGVLLLEFSEGDVAIYPRGCGLPRKIIRRIRIKPAFIFSQLERIEEMGIEIVWAGSREGGKEWISGQINLVNN